MLKTEYNKIRANELVEEAKKHEQAIGDNKYFCYEPDMLILLNEGAKVMKENDLSVGEEMYSTEIIYQGHHFITAGGEKSEKISDLIKSLQTAGKLE